MQGQEPLQLSQVVRSNPTRRSQGAGAATAALVQLRGGFQVHRECGGRGQSALVITEFTKERIIQIIGRSRGQAEFQLFEEIGRLRKHAW